jgi:hypothetical protein
LNSLVLLEALRTAHQAKLEVLDARVELALARSRLQALLEGAAAFPTTAPAAAPGATIPSTTTSDEVQP